MKKTLLITALLFTAACGDGRNKPTHGQLVEELSFHYCKELTECGFQGEAQEGQCRRHNVHHLCELEDTCDQTVDPLFMDILAECGAAIDAISDNQSCGQLFFGLVPEECGPLFDIPLD